MLRFYPGPRRRSPASRRSRQAATPGYDREVTPEDRQRACWYGRRTPQIPDDVGFHTIVDGELVYCAHPMYWPVVRFEFDIRNCEGCDQFRPRRQDAGPY